MLSALFVFTDFALFVSKHVYAALQSSENPAVLRASGRCWLHFSDTSALRTRELNAVWR